MKRWLLLLFILSLAMQAVIRAESPAESGLLIIEVQTGGEDSAGDEFVEIINLNFRPLALENIELQYMPASGSGWQTKAELAGHVHSHGRLLVSTEQAGLAGQEMSSGLAKTGGHIRIFDQSSSTEIDRLGWGTAAEPLGQAATAPDSGQSLKRLNGEDGYFTNEGNNSNDWHISDNPTPHNDEPYVPEDEPADKSPPLSSGTDTKADNTAEPTQAKTYVKVVINELMPDPDMPLTDANDEFVEFYNPNGFDVLLDGYVLKSGGDLRSSQPLEGLSIKAGSYLVLTSADNNISLSNSGGTVQLLDGNQKQISQSQYAGAKTGLSWSLYGGEWGWAQPTPGEANKGPEPGADTTQNLGSAAFAGGLNSGGTPESASDQRNVFEEPAEAEIAPIDYTILASVGGLAIIYVIYEYRHDIGNRIARFRGYLETRKANRRQHERGRNNRISQRYRRWQDGLRAWISRWNKQSR